MTAAEDRPHSPLPGNMNLFRSYRPYKCDVAARPSLVTIIDTEEEFDWSAAFSREQVSVKAMRAVGRGQELFDQFGIIPTYVVDYPVATQADGYEPLRDIFADGRCLIGAHLHPWVNPPYVEEVSRPHSFPGNLPRAVETEKLTVLREAIGERFGEPPVIYKAGRYGLGPNTPELLEEQGFLVDCSVCPELDSSGEGGPDYGGYGAAPFLFGRQNVVVELPLTSGYTGWGRSGGRTLHAWANSPLAGAMRAQGMLSRLGILDRVVLSPEGFSVKEMKTLVKTLHGDGLRVFSFAFHSPSLEPGHTPYVRSGRDLDAFLETCRRFFEFFFGEFGGVPEHPLQIRGRVVAAAATRSREGT